MKWPAALKPVARRLFADACVIGLRLSGWAAVTLLAALGCFVLLFLMLGNFEAAGFFSHLDNLARRFAEADAARRSHFLTLVGWVSVALVLVVTACRMRSLLAVFRLSPGVSHA